MSSCSDAGNGGNCSPLQKFTYRVWADLYVLLELSLMLPAMRSLATVSNLAIASPILPSPTAATVLAELVLAGGWLLALHCGRPALNYEIVHQPPGSGPLQYDLLLMLYTAQMKWRHLNKYSPLFARLTVNHMHHRHVVTQH